MTSTSSVSDVRAFPPPANRVELLSLLAEACELEHGLACSYLYAAFSLKQDVSEGGLTTRQLVLARQWAGQIFFVAAQEMLHLAQAWNLMVAAGGAPYYLRPNFPQPSKYYPLHLPLTLRPFSAETISGFVAFEKPDEVSDEHASILESVSRRAPAAGQETPFHSIAELYNRILEGFEKLPDVFIADPARQTAREIADFPDLVPVVDMASARAAIARIRFQGEGVSTDRSDCHFGVFMEILKSLLKEQAADYKFRPARDAEVNPTVLDQAISGALAAEPITHPYARDAAVLFDSVYTLTLRMLGYAFSASGGAAQAVGQVAILLMPTVIKPLGESLMLLPSSDRSGSRRAGPGFGLTRHVLYPDHAAIALRLSRERLIELASECDDLAGRPQAPAHLKDVAGRLRLAAERLTAQF